jgi:hypothetical protein
MLFSHVKTTPASGFSPTSSPQQAPASSASGAVHRGTSQAQTGTPGSRGSQHHSQTSLHPLTRSVMSLAFGADWAAASPPPPAALHRDEALGAGRRAAAAAAAAAAAHSPDPDTAGCVQAPSRVYTGIQTASSAASSAHGQCWRRAPAAATSRAGVSQSGPGSGWLPAGPGSSDISQEGPWPVAAAEERRRANKRLHLRRVAEIVVAHWKRCARERLQVCWHAASLLPFSPCAAWVLPSGTGKKEAQPQMIC